ncbi:MAG TPA: radical SAM protein, partial [Acidobacteriota bacterium]|nr:radical SAM protein [Acidobacteriota bacterium]
EIRKKIIRGEMPLESVINGNPGEIKAGLVEENGRILMRKRCEKHGDFEDVISTNPAFTRRIENLFFGRDFELADGAAIRRHGSSAIRYGRGTVLTVDLTNRCNMMCIPCFTDANQVGYVHEPGFEEIRNILDRAVSFKPRRQVIILFSGGEPTISPHFLDAVAYARRIGFYRILAATNGIRFAQSGDFARQAKAAGLDGAYLQFDGATNEANRHRGVKNLFDVKLRAIENMAAAGIKTTLVTTVINTVNRETVGQVVNFAIDNVDSIQTVVFQPVSFTGRDEEIDDESRAAKRYPLSMLAEDLHLQLDGKIEPLRDWFPLSAYSAFTSIMDVLQPPDAGWGWSSCNCHPDCGVFTLLVINRRTREWTPLFRFFDYERFLRDLRVIADTARGRRLIQVQLAQAVMRNYKPGLAPAGFPISQMLQLFRPGAGTSGSDRIDRMKKNPENRDGWRVLCVEGMLFQDLYTYDFRRTEMCVIPYGTQEGEISFCAYNTGIGWRRIVENAHKTADLAEWNRTRGRHEIFAAGKTVELEKRSQCSLNVQSCAAGDRTGAPQPTPERR